MHTPARRGSPRSPRLQTVGAARPSRRRPAGRGRSRKPWPREGKAARRRSACRDRGRPRSGCRASASRRSPRPTRAAGDSPATPAGPVRRAGNRSRRSRGRRAAERRPATARSRPATTRRRRPSPARPRQRVEPSRSALRAPRSRSSPCSRTLTGRSREVIQASAGWRRARKRPCPHRRGSYDVRAFGEGPVERPEARRRPPRGVKQG